jgi:hypothetical protein
MRGGTLRVTRAAKAAFKFFMTAMVSLIAGQLADAAYADEPARDDVRTVVLTGDPIPGEPLGVYMSQA